MGSDESHFDVSLIERDKVTRQCPHRQQFLKRKESRSGFEPRSCAYQPNALPLGHTGSLALRPQKPSQDGTSTFNSHSSRVRSFSVALRPQKPSGLLGTDEGGWEREIIYLSLHCHHQNDSCIKMGSGESHFNVSLSVRDKVTRQCPQTTTFLKKKESRSGIEPRPYALPLCQTA